jgi:hypothetical protein
VSLCPHDLFCPSAGTGRYRRMPVCRPSLVCRPSSNTCKLGHKPCFCMAFNTRYATAIFFSMLMGHTYLFRSCFYCYNFHFFNYPSLINLSNAFCPNQHLRHYNIYDSHSHTNCLIKAVSWRPWNHFLQVEVESLALEGIVSLSHSQMQVHLLHMDNATYLRCGIPTTWCLFSTQTSTHFR